MNKKSGQWQRMKTGGKGSASIIALRYYNHVSVSYAPYTPGYIPRSNSSSPKPGTESYFSVLTTVKYSIFQKTHYVLNKNKFSERALLHTQCSRSTSSHIIPLFFLLTAQITAVLTY